LSCFIRATLRGVLADIEYPYLTHEVLVHNFRQVVKKGLDAQVHHPKGKTAKQVCLHLLEVASRNATSEEKEYLPIINQRIRGGNLSNIILKRVAGKAQKTDFEEAILALYLRLADYLEKNDVCVN